MKKLPRLLLEAGLFCVAAAALNGAGVNIADWKHLQEVEIRNPGVVRVLLPPETLDAAAAHQRDVRLLNPAGQEQSYLLESPQSTPAETRGVSRFDARLLDQTTEITIVTGTNLPLEAVDLDTPHRHFIKAARVETSPDGRKWTEIAQGVPLFRQAGGEQLRIALDGRRAAHVRIHLDDARAEPVPFTRALLRLARSAGAPDVPLGVEIARREEFAGETLFTLALEARHAGLSKLSFETPEGVFTRRVSVAVRELRDGVAEERVVAVGTIFRLQLEGLETTEQLEIPLHFVPQSRELLVHVHNGDAPPLAITSAKVFRRPTALIFNASRDGTFLLLSGNSRATEPSYDLAGFAREFRRASIPTVTPRALELNPSFNPTDALAEMPLIGSPLDVEGWKRSRTVKTGKAPTQELELDLPVLAHARQDFGDLRIVQEGRQLPYLIEHTNLFRALDLPLAADNDPKKPTLSRWTITLPRENLPLHRLTLTSSTALFERTLRIYERVQTTRGDTYERTLATSVWRMVPGRENAKTNTIPLGSVVQSRELFIETENGDNPPITIGSATATHPVVRVIFKATGAAPVTLHYGNSSVSAPRYDVSLVAAQLLTAERAAATLGAEKDAGGGLAGSALRGLRGGPIFWISLGLVVIVLLVVVARLLPKPEEPAG